MKKILALIITPVLQKSWLSDLLFAIPRIICGLALAIDFGGSKFGVPWSPEGVELGFLQVADWFPKDVAEFGGIFVLAPVFFAWMAAASEAIGGMLLALGLKTRFASFLIVCTMLVAIFFQKWGQGLWAVLPAMGFLWIGLYNLVLGSGRFGLDFLISKYLLNKSHAPKLVNSLAH